MKFIFLILAVFVVTEGRAEEQLFDEYKVKSVFLLNITNFVRWPEDAFTTPATPFKIVILGDDPFKWILDKTVKGESVQGRPIVIERHQSHEGVPPCHLLFISSSLKRKVPAILAEMKQARTLTVADFPGFCRQGGMINLVFRNNRVQIETNAKEAEQAGLQINSKLLRISVNY
jgi:hypothetical protein